MSDFRIGIRLINGETFHVSYFGTTKEDVVQEFHKLVLSVIRENEYDPSFLYFSPRMVISATLFEIDEEEQPTKVLYRFVA